MEVALAAPQTPMVPLRIGTPRPLSQLVQESRSRAKVPNRLLESKIYTKLKSNGLIHAEPPELHFSGFELDKDYIKILKLINISSEVMNIHIIPTQTKHFQTSYTKKYRLIPGLAYTLKVRLCPDEWRYFYDCIRVHCKGEENLLIPVHAYPVIDDLHIPPRIDLPAVPLGQSVCHAIPLRCSCPIDFEFHVYVIQPNEAFSIHPLTGVIPASGEETITVTFSPFQFETGQVTIQLMISQFNTKPYLCTITGSSAPHEAFSEPVRKSGHAVHIGYKGPYLASEMLPRSKNKWRSTKEADRSKTLTDQTGAKAGLKPPVDVCSPALVAKMLIKNPDKLSVRDLREAMSCGSLVVMHNTQMKKALFIKKVNQNVKDEQTNKLLWKVHLGKDPMSEHTKRQIAEGREIALHEYMVKRGDGWHEEDLAFGKPKLSTRRVVREAGQVCKGAPSFQLYRSFHWELRRRALRLFQQVARKIVIRCRMNRRLTCLKKLSDSRRNLPLAKKEEETTCDLEITPDQIFPFAFPVFFNEDDLLAPGNLVPLPVDPIDVTVTTHIPFFKLQVPQHYKLMGYRSVSTWDAFNSYVPTTLARPLRTGPPDEPVPNEVEAQSSTAESEAREEPQDGNEKGEVKAACLSFSAPEALLKSFPANPVRIFNPDPDLQTYKPTPKYLDIDLEVHLCPLPRHTIPGSDVCCGGTPTPHTPNSQDHKEVISDIMTWKEFDLLTSKCLFNQPAFVSDYAPRRCVDYSTDTLPLTAPPCLTGPLEDLPPLMDTPCEGSGVQLRPEIIRAEFLSTEALVSNSNLTSRTTVRHQKELQKEATYRSECNQMGTRVMAKLKNFGVIDRTSPREDSE